MGVRSSRANALSWIDIAIVENARHVVSGTKGQRVVLLCEVEEEGARPKKIIGNLCNILFSDGIQIHGSSYHLDKTYVLIGIRCDEGGKAREKAEEIIARVKKIASRELIVNIEGIYGCSHQELIEAVRQRVLIVSGVIEPETCIQGSY